VWRNEGPTRLAALYRGLNVNLVGNSAGWALYFLLYDRAKRTIKSYRGYAPSQELTSIDYLTASTASGMLSAVLTNPIWVVKTRMLSTAATDEGAYPGLYQGVRSILQKEGVRGCFHGLSPTLIGVSHGSLYFLAYEKLNTWRRKRNVAQGKGTELSNRDTIINTSLSKLFAGTITYPHQVLRARMQAQTTPGVKYPGQPNIGLIALIKSVWRNEGAPGFYKGMFPNLLRVVPSACVTFLVYENVKWGLPQLFEAVPGP
jgi:solute carrier family 25 (mitochondrial folate transporter), member 32